LLAVNFSTPGSALPGTAPFASHVRGFTLSFAAAMCALEQLRKYWPGSAAGTPARTI
jgi:hypothetical protein